MINHFRYELMLDPLRPRAICGESEYITTFNGDVVTKDTSPMYIADDEGRKLYMYSENDFYLGNGNIVIQTRRLKDYPETKSTLTLNVNVISGCEQKIIVKPSAL